MLSNQEKILEFGRSIERELGAQIAQIDSEVESYKQSQTQIIEDEVYNDCYRMIQKQTAKIKLELTTERSRRLSEMKKNLLLKRDEYVTLIFEDVKKRLLEFSQSQAYEKFLQERLFKAAQSYPFSQPHILVKQSDLSHKGILEKIFPGCVVEPSPDIVIGGFILKDAYKPYVVNESLDSILEEQKVWFYSHSGLRITQF